MTRYTVRYPNVKRKRAPSRAWAPGRDLLRAGAALEAAEVANRAPAAEVARVGEVDAGVDTVARHAEAGVEVVRRVPDQRLPLDLRGEPPVTRVRKELLGHPVGALGRLGVEHLTDSLAVDAELLVVIGRLPP
ncbi:hypothetical protein, partial [Salana multivorans]|uniref:hypothetical protein n=1 Tax=Salana multivorans TaxID=120377 RepID=UPI001B86ABE4